MTPVRTRFGQSALFKTWYAARSDTDQAKSSDPSVFFLFSLFTFSML